ncbi:MAG: rhodanese-like domain-containing protein [Acidimicrobiia bacterium]|nr:rhodanese-like domain-containing protein [Acidimicrobiia bacterium]
MSIALAPVSVQSEIPVPVAVETPSPVPEADPLSVEQWRRAGNAVIIDVRERDEFDEERIQGALLFPKSEFNPAAFPSFGPLKLVLVCLAGKRSLAVGDALRAAGRVEAVSLRGGMLGWMAAGLPVDTGGR